MLRFAFRRGPGVRSFTAEAATKPKLTVSERVKGDKQGLVGVAASTLAFILSAQSFRMRNERDEAIERAEAAEASLSDAMARLKRLRVGTDGALDVARDSGVAFDSVAAPAAAAAAAAAAPAATAPKSRVTIV
jgi:hypothetical protein